MLLIASIRMIAVDKDREEKKCTLLHDDLHWQTLRDLGE